LSSCTRISGCSVAPVYASSGPSGLICTYSDDSSNVCLFGGDNAYCNLGSMYHVSYNRNIARWEVLNC
jgi:hypothetical protein